MEHDIRLASREAVEAKPEWSEALVALEKLENGLHKVNADLDRLRAQLAALGRELEAPAEGQNSQANAAGAGQDAALPVAALSVPTSSRRLTG